MQIICCFCKRHIAYKEPYDDKRISHGACKKCEAEQNAILDEMLEKEKRIKKYKEEHPDAHNLP